MYNVSFPGRITYGGTGILKLVRSRFDELGIKERILGTPFEQFFTESELGFSPVLVHTLLQKKIEATVRGEIHFGIGGKRVRFGCLEYALVSGMSYEDGPTKAEQDERNNDRLITDHLNGVAGSKLSALINAFTICRSPDDAFKLGLLVFVYGYLLGQPANKAIEERWQKFLYIVQDLPFFFKMPWGNLSWAETYSSLSVNLRRYHETLQKKLKDKPDVAQKEAKYTLTGNLHTLHYWAYEAIPEIGMRFGSNQGIRVPRMHSWSSNVLIMGKDIEAVLNKKTVTFYYLSFINVFYIILEYW